MNIKRSILKKINKLFKLEQNEIPSIFIKNLYQTEFKKTVLISYITSPFISENNFTHQNHITSHIVAKSYFELGFNVDIVDFFEGNIKIEYANYDTIFGFGFNFEQSFYNLTIPIHRILFVTGAHEVFQNAMSLKSVEDFQKMSGMFIVKESKVLRISTYYSMYCADSAIILAKDLVFNDFRMRFKNKLYSLNNNIIGAFTKLAQKTIENRNKNFLFLSGASQLAKGLHILLAVAKKRSELNFYIVVPSIDSQLENYYYDLLYRTENIRFAKNIKMNSDLMREFVENCSYVVTPSYVDGLPGGTIEPMSAGLIPIVSENCGFENKEFIFLMEELSMTGLDNSINHALNLSDEKYLEYSNAVKRYTMDNFSEMSVKYELIKILKTEFHS